LPIISTTAQILLESNLCVPCNFSQLSVGLPRLSGNRNRVKTAVFRVSFPLWLPPLLRCLPCLDPAAPDPVAPERNQLIRKVRVRHS